MKIAAQMYSIRKYTEENGYGASLKELARIGFKAVEHACGFGEFDGKPGEDGYTPREKIVKIFLLRNFTGKNFLLNIVDNTIT